MSKDPVPEWFGKGEAEPPRQRGSAEARSSVGCGMPFVLALLIAAAGAGAFFMVKRPPRSTPLVAPVTANPLAEPVAVPTPEPPRPAEPVAPPTPVDPLQPEPETAPAPSAGEAGDASPGANERLTSVKIQLVMNNARKRFQACYENALKYSPDAAGSVKISMTINPEGRVPVVSATPTGNLPPQVATCIAAIARTLRFPPSSEQTSVNYPLVFKSG